MNNYIIIVLGWILGQAAYACKKSWDLQKRTEGLSFKSALHLLFTKETAAFAFGIVMLFIVIFILPNIIDLDVTKEELKGTDAAKWKYYFISFIRVIAVVFGYVCQNVGYFLFGKTEKILKDRAARDNIAMP
jgi:hypothetical protein